MKNLLKFLVIAVGLIIPATSYSHGFPTTSYSHGFHGGGGFHGGHGFHGGGGFHGGFYGAPYYPYYQYQQTYWYCPEYQAYYPYVANCPTGWLPVYR